MRLFFIIFFLLISLYTLYRKSDFICLKYQIIKRNQETEAARISEENYLKYISNVTQMS